MDRVDGSDHYERTAKEEAPSLLTIVLDTNPHAWALLANTLTLSKAVANLIVFINAHLAINNANQVAVVASHSHRAVWLYPPTGVKKQSHADVEMQDAGESTKIKASDAKKYRPFALIEQDIMSSIRNLVAQTSPDDVASTTSTQMAGALSLALCYINKASLQYSDASPAKVKSDMDPVTAGIDPASEGLQSRILVISVSGDLADQYIPLMNTTFAAQTMRVPIDICKLAGDTVFLQQAADATKGIYMQLDHPRGFLQYLMMAFLPDQIARLHLIAPTQDVVDFRAACFCHRKVVDVGFVCSICLSIFCSPPEGAICTICGTHLSLGDYGGKPAVVPRKKKKKKRINGVESSSRLGTPMPGE